MKIINSFLLLSSNFFFFSLHGDCQTTYNIHPLAKYEAMEIEEELENAENTKIMEELRLGNKE